MKNILTLTAIAVLTIFAAVSCAPEAQITGMNYNKININNRPENNGFNLEDDVLPSIEDYQTKKEKPEVVIKIPAKADIHKGKEFTAAKLQEFLSFHEYTNPDPTDTAFYDKGGISTLKEAIPYTIKNKVGEIVTITLDRTFTTNHSPIIVKISAKNYKFSSGVLLDLDNNGIGGEEGYDDLYTDNAGALLIEDYTTLSPVNGDFLRPRNAGWSVTLDFNIVDFTYPGSLWESKDATETVQGNLIVDAITCDLFDPMDPTNVNRLAAVKDIAALVAGNVELQEFDPDAKKWMTFKTAIYNEEGAYKTSLRFEGFKFKHKRLYRLAWNGSKKLLTSGTYYGLKQRVSVEGENKGFKETWERYENTYVTSDTYWSANPLVESPVEVLVGGLLAVVLPSSINVSKIVKNTNGSDVTLRVEFPLLGFEGNLTNPRVGLPNIDLAAFKQSFKIVYRGANSSGVYPSAINSFSSYLAATNVVEVEITGISFAKEATGTDKDYFNVIYVTLDPKFIITGKNFTILINDGLKYSGSSPVRQFGNQRNFEFGNFEFAKTFN